MFKALSKTQCQGFRIWNEKNDCFEWRRQNGVRPTHSYDIHGMLFGALLEYIMNIYVCRGDRDVWTITYNGIGYNHRRELKSVGAGLV